MNDINHFGGIVRVLETPNNSSIFGDNDKLMTKVRVQLPQTRNTQIVELIFWGYLASDIATFYKANDYLLIEGYLSLPVKLDSKRVEITVLKVYPFTVDYNQKSLNE